LHLDVEARVFADQFAATVRQSVVVENRPAPGGIAAMKALVGSEPDGYTLGYATMNQIVFDSYLFPGLPYDPVKDLAPITLLVSHTNAIAVLKSFAADTFAKFVATATTQPGNLNVGTAPRGTGLQIFAHVLMHIAALTYLT
jgi:tripartite-type tricarboxylate transporter receptor subunit TctC